MIDLNHKSCDSINNGTSIIDVGMKQSVKKKNKSSQARRKKDSHTIHTIRKQIISSFTKIKNSHTIPSGNKEFYHKMQKIKKPQKFKNTLQILKISSTHRMKEKLLTQYTPSLKNKHSSLFAKNKIS